MVCIDLANITNFIILVKLMFVIINWTNIIICIGVDRWSINNLFNKSLKSITNQTQQQ